MARSRASFAAFLVNATNAILIWWCSSRANSCSTSSKRLCVFPVPGGPSIILVFRHLKSHLVSLRWQLVHTYNAFHAYSSFMVLKLFPALTPIISCITFNFSRPLFLHDETVKARPDYHKNVHRCCGEWPHFINWIVHHCCYLHTLNSI